VGHVGHEHPVPVEQPVALGDAVLDAVGHRVDRFRQFGELVTWPAGRHSRR
jgi:hypothetical protein